MHSFWFQKNNTFSALRRHMHCFIFPSSRQVQCALLLYKHKSWLLRKMHACVPWVFLTTHEIPPSSVATLFSCLLNLQVEYTRTLLSLENYLAHTRYIYNRSKMFYLCFVRISRQLHDKTMHGSKYTKKNITRNI